MFEDTYFDAGYFGWGIAPNAMGVREIAGSESGHDALDGGSASIVYSVRGSDNIPAMRSAVAIRLPTYYDNLTLDKLDRQYDDEGNRWIWTGDYNYRPPQALLRWAFDTQSGSVRLTTSRGTNRYPSNAPNFRGAIGVNGGEVGGVDVVIPALKLTATYRWPKNVFTMAKVKALGAMTGMLNDGTWQTYAPGELLFLGASGELVTGLPTEVSYYFAASANVSGLSFGAIANVAKRGHDYLWVLYEDEEDSTAKKLVKTPLAVYVERVYTETNFATLGIGS